MKRYVTALALVCVCATPVRAQDALLAECSNVLPSQSVSNAVLGQFQFMCAQVVNSLATIQPSVGIAFSGGNPVLGTGTTLGRRFGMVPRVSVTARANMALAEVPELFDGYASQIADGAATLGPVGTTGVPIGSIQGDLAIGLFNGISPTPLVGGIGAIDLLGSVAFLPRIEQVGLTDAIMNIGVGARVGLIRQGLLVPGISVSGMYRRMDQIGFGDIDEGDTGAFTTDLRTLSLRTVVSKGILAFDFAVGAGYDRYTSDLGLDWYLTCATSECLAANGGTALTLEGGIENELSTAAWNVFGDVSLNLLILNLVAEVGYQKAIDPLTADDLQRANLPSQSLTTEQLSGGRLFGSVGLRVSL